MRLPDIKFFKDYAVPISATVLLLLIVVVLLLLRYWELLSIQGFANSNPLITDSNSSLVSQDKSAELNSDNNNQQSTATQTQTSASPATQTTDQTTTSGDTTVTGSDDTPMTPSGTSGNGSSGSGSGGTTTPPVFSAIIDRLTHYEFPTNTTMCAYNHNFEGIIYTNNGPGTVTYQWRRSFPTGFITPVESFTAPTGFYQRSVGHQWAIAQSTSSGYWLELVILSPSPSVKRVTFNHHCP